MCERESVLEYEPGHHTVADTLVESLFRWVDPLSLRPTTDSRWRVDQVTGLIDGLADIEAAFLKLSNPSYR